MNFLSRNYELQKIIELPWAALHSESNQAIEQKVAYVMMATQQWS